MSLRNRTLFLISLLLTGAILVTASILTWNARQSLLDEQRADGEVMARMLARAAYIVQNLPDEMENAIAEQMVTEATITAHFVAAAEDAGWSPDTINTRLKQIVASTSLSEFWITDEKGHAYLRSQGSIDFTFSPDAVANPQSYIFYQLLTPDRNPAIIQPAARRDYDGKIFKYVGVTGVDKPRIVQVGFEAEALNAVRQRVSLERLGKELVEGGEVRAIRIVDSDIETQVFQAGQGVDKDLSALDLSMLKSALSQGQSQSYVEEGLLKVIEPIHSIDTGGGLSNVADGAVILFLPTDRLQAAIERQIAQAVIAAFAILLVGVVMSILMSRAVTRPLDSFRAAAASVQAGGYRPDFLETMVTRKDELGRLGRVFDQMAREVGSRDRRLNLLRVIIPMGVALSAEKDFSRLLETIVVEAQRLTNADAGSLYLITDENTLKFVIVRNTTLDIALGGATGNEMTLNPIPLYDEQGGPNHHHIASYCALTGKHISIQDAYTTTEFDLSGTRAFDAQTGYRTKSMLTMPLKDTSNNVIGVLQLLNAQDYKTNEIVPFQEDEVVDSLALITSAALSAYIREEALRVEINKLRIEIDHSKQSKQVDEIAESDYFKNLQVQAALLRKNRKS